jgi:hypothetical protein
MRPGPESGTVSSILRGSYLLHPTTKVLWFPGTALIASIALTIKLSSTCCNWTQSSTSISITGTSLVRTSSSRSTSATSIFHLVNHQNWIGEGQPIQLLKCRKQMILHSWQKRVRCAIEDLNGGLVLAERPMTSERVDGGPVVHDQMGPFHLEILEKVAHAITAIERASDDVIEAQARLPIIHHLSERCGQIRRGQLYYEHRYDLKPALAEKN